jgi:hypothetical protein
MLMCTTIAQLTYQYLVTYSSLDILKLHTDFFQVLYMNNKDQTEINLLISYGKMLNQNTKSKEDLLLKIEILN